MKTIKLLYLEHDELAISFFKRALELDNNQIQSQICKDIDEGIKVLSENKFDILLTDVLWPDPESGEENNKLFPEIIKKIRNINSRIPIIAFSGKGDTHKEVLKYQDEVYDIWSKSGGYPEFLPYRVQHFIYSWQNEMAEKTLIETVENFLIENPSCWGASDINTFIKSYTEELMSSGDLFLRIIHLFKELSSKAGLKTTQTKKMLDAFSKFEPLDLAKNSTAWGHLRHSLSVFLVGYLLINEKSQFLLEKIFLNTRAKDINQANKTWFIISAFHDSSIFLENIFEILKNIEEYTTQHHFYKLRIKESGQTVPKTSELEEYCTSNLFETINKILEANNFEKQSDLFKDYIKKNIDHGVIGAATLYENNVGNSKISNDLVQESCFAILVHKCFLHDKLNLNISNNKYLFAQLLCLIDSFQAWGRESQYQNIHDGTSIEKVVLRDINLTRNDKLNLNLKIDYLPFNYLSPSDTRLLTIDVPKLKDIIRNLYDELENIGIVKNSNGQYSWQDINLNFTYMIQGKSMNI